MVETSRVELVIARISNVLNIAENDWYGVHAVILDQAVVAAWLEMTSILWDRVYWPELYGFKQTWDQRVCLWATVSACFM